MFSTKTVRRGLGVALAGAALAPVTALATSGSTELDLVGGDKLQSNAWHCGIYFNACSWKTSAKLLGSTPKRASWIQNNSEVQVHGPFAKITLGKSSNIEITFKSKTLIKTRWRNTHTWISASSGKVKPSKTTIYVSVRAKAYASHKIFGKPGPVESYAGAA